jgi:RNA recognition motif-containing protein
MLKPVLGVAVSNEIKCMVLLKFQNYDTSESKLRREFESYGAVKKVRMVNFNLF